MLKGLNYPRMLQKAIKCSSRFSSLSHKSDFVWYVVFLSYIVLIFFATILFGKQFIFISSIFNTDIFQEKQMRRNYEGIFCRHACCLLLAVRSRTLSGLAVQFNSRNTVFCENEIIFLLRAG